MDIGAGAAGLVVSGLTRRRGLTPGLEALTLSVAQGKLTALVGAAGSGKSTLLRILAGFERPRGKIMFEGRDVARLPPYRRGFGVVQQPDALFPRLTLAENVAFPLRMRGIARAARARLTAETLDLWGVARHGRLMPGEAGPALCQRAMLARATVFGPRLLLLDEPFSGQDDTARAELIATLRRVHALLGATTVFATRHGADALALADRMAILRAGVIEQYGTPEEVFDRPRDAGVAALLGDINCLPGVVEAIEDDVATVRLACGPLVEAAGSGDLASGDGCVVTVRPDRIAIAAVPASEMGEGAIDGTLIEMLFLGTTYRLRLLVGSGAELVVRRPATAGLRGLAVGRVAALAWQPHHAQAFAAEACRAAGAFPEDGGRTP